jgi:hypothetical protein
MTGAISSFVIFSEGIKKTCAGADGFALELESDG